MRNTQSGKLRSDKPSGRQAAEQPEHSEKNPAASSLHQGRGPDFPTQDSHVQKGNPGLAQLRRQPVERKKSAYRPQDSPESAGTNERNDKEKEDKNEE